MSELEQVRAAQGNAAAMTSDLRSIYGFRNSFGYQMPPSVFSAAPPQRSVKGPK